MSLARFAAVSGTPDVTKNGNNDSGYPNSSLNPEIHGVVYTCESYCGDDHGYTPFFGSASDEPVYQNGSSLPENVLHGTDSPSSFSMARKNSSFVSSENYGFRFDIESACFNTQNPDVMEYNEGGMRLKLQELEKALLDDNDNDMTNFYNGVEVDNEWAVTTSGALLHDSPKESSSSGSSSVLSTSTAERVSTTPSSPKSLLFECAALVHYGALDKATEMIHALRERVSIQGDPCERIAAYMVEALAARIAQSGKGLYKALKCKPQPTSDRLSAMQVLFEVCPCFRFGFMTANSAILEACRDQNKLHIVDFDINQGSQYYTLLKSLAKIHGTRPQVRLTGVDDPESVQRAVGGLRVIGQRLQQLAEDLQLSFEFHAVAAETALVSPSMLDCRPDEALVVNFAFQLHHMPDESVSTVNLRDRLLRMVKSLKPKLVTVVEQDVNTNTAPFLSRFSEAYSYYSAVFESLDAALPRDSQDRMNVEKHCLARDIINIIACEGEERLERYEVAGKWRARMTMAGFASFPIGSKVKSEISELIQHYSSRYKMKDEMGALHFGWEDKFLVVASAWGASHL